MADRGGEFSFHVIIDVRIYNFFSIRSIITKFGRQVHLQDLTRMRLTKQLLVT